MLAMEGKDAARAPLYAAPLCLTGAVGDTRRGDGGGLDTLGHVIATPGRRAGGRGRRAHARHLRPRPRPEWQARLHAVLLVDDLDEGVAGDDRRGLRRWPGPAGPLALRQAALGSARMGRRRPPHLGPPRVPRLAAGGLPLPVVTRLS